MSSTSVSGLVTCAYSDYDYVNFKIHWAVTRIQSSTHLKDESLNTLKRQTCDKKKAPQSLLRTLVIKEWPYKIIMYFNKYRILTGSKWFKRKG